MSGNEFDFRIDLPGRKTLGLGKAIMILSPPIALTMYGWFVKNYLPYARLGDVSLIPFTFALIFSVVAFFLIRNEIKPPELILRGNDLVYVDNERSGKVELSSNTKFIVLPGTGLVVRDGGLVSVHSEHLTDEVQQILEGLSQRLGAEWNEPVNVFEADSGPRYAEMPYPVGTAYICGIIGFMYFIRDRGGVWWHSAGVAVGLWLIAQLLRPAFARELSHVQRLFLFDEYIYYTDNGDKVFYFRDIREVKATGRGGLHISGVFNELRLPPALATDEIKSLIAERIPEKPNPVGTETHPPNSE